MAPKPPASLLRYMREGRCVLFCGSGLSAWAKLPTWKKLLEQIVKELSDETPDNPDLSELSRLLEDGKLLEVADHCKEALGPQRYYSILSEHLRGEAVAIPEPHKIIAQLPFSAIVTTNYDKLLERSFAEVSSWPKTPTHQDVDMLGPLLFDGGFFILKAHGDIDRSETMILTTRDYQRIIHANPAFNSIFSAILYTKALLFVGYSLNDPDFRLLFDRQLTVFGGNIPERYALITGTGKVERDVLWRTAKIRVLPYEEGKHEQVLEFLRSLLEQIRGEAEETQTVAKARGATAATAESVVTTPVVEAQPAVPVVSTPTTILSLQLKGQGLEVYIQTEGRTGQWMSTPPDWAMQTKLMREAFRSKANAQFFGLTLGTCLPDNVLPILKGIPADHVITLRLSPELEVLPWEWLTIDGEFLSMLHPVVRAPIGVSDSARGYPIVREPVRVLLIGDPNQGEEGLPGLPGALEEVKDIANIYSEYQGIICDTLIGSQARYFKVATTLAQNDYDVIHFAGHAWFDELEPYIILSEQVKLHSSELRSMLSRRPPAILFLNSHFTSFVPPGASRHEATQTVAEEQKPLLSGQRGFSEAASTAGVGTLIGSFYDELIDVPARQVGVNFHKELLNGVPVARALHKAMLLSAPTEETDNLTHQSYAMSGYGDIVLPLTRKKMPLLKRERYNYSKKSSKKSSGK
jgi:hypothetical protein